MITSTSNRRVRELRALAARPRERRETGLFLAEGRRLVEEAPEDLLEAVYCSESFAARPEHESLLRRLQPERMADSVFAAVSETQTPQGILAVVRQRHWELSDLTGGGRPLLILESIQDPGNLGTMLRTGEGAGIGGIVANRETVDLYNPKTVRATMGSVYRVPFWVAGELPDALAQIRANGYRIYAAHLQGACDYTETDYTGPCAFLIGNEGNGLTEAAAGLADATIRIPMEGRVESLNAAIAATLLIYEARRQRMQAGENSPDCGMQNILKN